MGRAPCCDKVNVKRGPWSPEEDSILKAYIEEKGTCGNWIALPQKIGLNRCGKSCRLRWLNYLRPNIKHGGFSEEEDQLICNLYITIGSRWSIIAAQLPGRTDNDIKNYWNTKLKKKLLRPRKDPSQFCRSLSLNEELMTNSKPNRSDNEGTPLQNLSSTALERMQLHLQLQGLHNPFSSFYNNPALWPKFHPLGSTSSHFQGQEDANPTHQLASDQTSELGSIQQHETNYPPINYAGMHEGLSENLNLDSMADGLHDELQNFLYGDMNGFDEKSSSSTWDSVTEYVLGYDL